MEARVDAIASGVLSARAVLFAEDEPCVSPSCESLVEGHLDALHGYALSHCRHRDLAEDAVQRTFLKAFQKRGQLKEPSAARGWLLTILRNELAMEWRRRRRLVALEEPEWEELPGEEAEEPAMDPALLAMLPQALDRLSEDARDILLLRYQQEFSYEQISGLLGIPFGTVQSRLHRAKLALRTHLSPASGGRS